MTAPRAFLRVSPPALTLNVNARGRSAENGFDSSMRSAEHGFTLVEMMVVVALVGLLAGVVMLATRNDARAVTGAASKLALRIAATRDLAIVDGRATRIDVAAGGYRIVQRRGGTWAPATDPAFAAARWPEGIAVSADRGAVAFDSGGLPDASATFTLTSDAARAVVRIDSAGGVDVAR